jgi:hypothetical protein
MKPRCLCLSQRRVTVQCPLRCHPDPAVPNPHSTVFLVLVCVKDERASGEVDARGVLRRVKISTQATEEVEGHVFAKTR